MQLDTTVAAGEMLTCEQPIEFEAWVHTRASTYGAGSGISLSANNVFPMCSLLEEHAYKCSCLSLSVQCMMQNSYTN